MCKTKCKIKFIHSTAPPPSHTPPPTPTQVRVLVTHGIGFLPQCDLIVVMADGKITEVGNYNTLIDNNGAFAEFLRTYSNTDKDDEEVPGN